ncbi:DUF1287 domain-containing protein [Mesorhizobium sp. C268A]|uniref:DUF1287 domain-containing protein n=1 Tax=Mesorhizobium sp. LSJC268A00 TaxID=1287325 RepID=UPI000408C1D2|nr:DUF1287 domain-containing protein [Mesorhizobium sp. LSJC268A00]
MTTLTRRTALQFGLLCLAAPAARAQENPAAPDWRSKLVEAAREQIGVTTFYDPAYVRLGYPGGDVAPDRGVCTDVIVRAYRRAFNLDLQKLVHEDMAANFAAYPKTWGLKATDRNIDHRRVGNLAAFFGRKGASLAVSEDPADFQPGDLSPRCCPATCRTSSSSHPNARRTCRNERWSSTISGRAPARRTRCLPSRRPGITVSCLPDGVS